MKDRKLALRYARALLSALHDPAILEKTDAFLAALARALEGSAELRSALLDPAVPRGVRKRVLAAIAERNGLPREVRNFLATLTDNNRISALASIATVFHEELEKKMGVVPAELITAAPVGDELLTRAQATLERVTGRRVRLTSRVDATLIGGAVTRVGSTVYDGSLRRQIDQLRRKMAEG
ncbi:MAG TPA: ATP synthase F1 subunit delta [Candidatus Polarisedimenticolaceae bacterium]|nr:ATP synthase F1 subunit delta [Candidatus Polarisedimenticolaceae bacterium]